MKKNRITLLRIAPYLATLVILLVLGCQGEPTKKEEKEPEKTKQVTIPSFDRDSAKSYVAKQLSFGPRVPNTKAHAECADWLASKLESFGTKVYRQSFEARTAFGDDITGENIIGAFNPGHSRRVILAAHWDSRKVADYDPREENREQPVPGADDGASGVGVLIEIARLLEENPIDLGVDIIFFDAEDQGKSGVQKDYSWCLGSQHWAKNPHVNGYKAQYGILLDMVGAKNARFTFEEFSRVNAGALLRRVWDLAQKMGYGNYFISERGGAVTDDHRMVMEFARIPMINIINRPVGSETGFVPHWHTVNDDLDVINKRTLKVVGQVVTAVIYNEAMGKF